DDVRLVINNARRYNKPTTPIHRAAVKLLESAEPILAELEALDERLSDPNITAHYVSQILDPQAVQELFEFDYDTVDPEGKKALAAENRVREEEAAAAAAVAAAAEEAQAVAAEKQLEEEQVGAAVAAAADDDEAKAKPNGKRKGKGKGKATVRQDSHPREDAMDVDEPAADSSTVAAAPAPAPERPKKRSAELAGLDSTPVPATRTTRKAAAASAAPEAARASLPPAAKKAKTASTNAATPKPRGNTATTVAASSKAAAQPQSPTKPMPEVLADEEIDSKTLFTHFDAGSRRRSSTGAGMVSAPSAVPRKTPRADNAALPEVAEETAATSAASATTKSAAGGGGRKASTSKAGKAKAEAAATPVVGEGAGSKEAPSGSEPASNRSTKGKGKAKARPSTGSVEIAETPPPPPPQESGSPNKPRPPTAASIKQDKQLQADWERRFNELGATVAITDDSQLEDGTLVWARSGPHPFYPAEVVDPYAEDTPPWLKAEARRPGEVNKIAVMYFDDTRSGNFLVRSMIRLLGENKEFDKLLLEPFSIRAQRRMFRMANKKAHGPSLQQDLEEAYNAAMSLAENEEDRAAAAVTASGTSNRKKRARKGGKKRK
ncbi:hypothetical protein C6P46_001828, partial [Rhodotorula mucilaginosa]